MKALFQHFIVDSYQWSFPLSQLMESVLECTVGSKAVRIPLPKIVLNLDLGLETQRGQELGAGMLAACSTTAGIVSEAATYPMHLVKTRLMTQVSPSPPFPSLY